MIETNDEQSFFNLIETTLSIKSYNHTIRRIWRYPIYNEISVVDYSSYRKKRSNVSRNIALANGGYNYTTNKHSECASHILAYYLLPTRYHAHFIQYIFYIMTICILFHSWVNQWRPNHFLERVFINFFASS